tara:strand:- start:1285 stop:1863 length:579 start_codon:yes stop_codon:yes gene_type:complete
MPRTTVSATDTELAKDSINIVNLIEFKSIGGSDVHLTDAPVDLAFDDGDGSDTYLSSRGVLGVSDIQEENEIKIETVNLTLSGIDTANVKLFLDFDYIDRRVLVRRAILDNQYNIVGDPVLVFDGRLDQPRVLEDFQSKTATLSVSASSHWADFEAQAGRHTNDTEQQVIHTGDTFFAKVTDTQKDVKWGRA